MDIRQATLHLIPNWLQRSQGTEVYEKPDLPGIWQVVHRYIRPDCKLRW